MISEKLLTDLFSCTKSLLQYVWWALLCFILASCVLILCQRQMIYLRRHYPFKHLPTAKNLTTLNYEVNENQQIAFFYHPQTAYPKKIWLLLGGNASLALQWLSVLQPLSLTDTGYLLIDYPGYGYNQGYPSQKNNQQAVIHAFQALEKHYGTSQFCSVNVIGHSLGSAVAIDTASTIKPDSLLLISPFTSMYEMSQRVITPLWAWLISPWLWDRYDNINTLTHYMASQQQTHVTVMHGKQDNIVPFSMGKTLASSHPAIKFIAISTDHDLPIVHPEHIQTYIITQSAQQSSDC